MSRVRGRVAGAALAWPILFLGLLLLVLYAYPGYMTYDSFDQLLQARGVQPVTDWHPPDQITQPRRQRVDDEIWLVVLGTDSVTTTP